MRAEDVGNIIGAGVTSGAIAVLVAYALWLLFEGETRRWPGFLPLCRNLWSLQKRAALLFLHGAQRVDESLKKAVEEPDCITQHEIVNFEIVLYHKIIDEEAFEHVKGCRKYVMRDEKVVPNPDYPVRPLNA